MKKIIYAVFYFSLALTLLACSSKTQNQNELAESSDDLVEGVVEITDENLKQSKHALLQQMANDLYLEAEKELEAGPTVKMDETGIYDDIKPVEVELETLPALDLGIEAQEEPEKIAQD